MKAGKWISGFAWILLMVSASRHAASEQAADAGQPAPPQLKFVFEELVTLDADVHVGETPMGKRNIVPITGGTFYGPGLKGRILPGGWDWQLLNASGCSSISADYMIETDDGVIIHVVNGGTLCPNSQGTKETRLTTPVFEAPKGKYDWLNGGAYVGTLAGATVDGKRAVKIQYFKAYPHS